MNKYYYNKDFFKNIDTEEKAYWLGFIMADGCILENFNHKSHKLKALKLQIALSRQDREHLVKFVHSIDGNIEIKDNIVNCGDVKCETSRVHVCCTDMCRDLISLNCTSRKSLTLEYPKIPYNLQNHFIRGYFDGDGSVSYSICNCFVKRDGKYEDIVNFYVNILGTSMFLTELKKELENNNIKVSDLKYYKDDIPEIRITGRENLLNYFKYLYNDSNVFLQRKYDKFIYAFNELNLAC